MHLTTIGHLVRTKGTLRQALVCYSFFKNVNLHMHEMTIAVSIVDVAVTTANQNNAAKINAISLEVGALSGIEQEALEFCFSEACKNTIAEGAKLIYRSLPATAHCPNCNNTFEAWERAEPCPDCNEMVFQLSGGTEMRVKEINVD